MKPVDDDLISVKSRVMHTLEHGLQFDLSTEQAKRFLQRHVNSKVELVILYVDIYGSTNLSMIVSPMQFALIIQIFSQETSIIISGYGGYLLKFVGDAVIAIFPAEFNKARACENAIYCSRAILKVIEEGLNPLLLDKGYPRINVKIGIDVGYSQIVLYGKSINKAHLDIIGSCISITSKITSIAQNNEILIGQGIYDLLDDKIKNSFINCDMKFPKLGNSSSNLSYMLYKYIN